MILSIKNLDDKHIRISNYFLSLNIINLYMKLFSWPKQDKLGVTWYHLSNIRFKGSYQSENHIIIFSVHSVRSRNKTTYYLYSTLCRIYWTSLIFHSADMELIFMLTFHHLEPLNLSKFPEKMFSTLIKQSSRPQRNLYTTLYYQCQHYLYKHLVELF